MSACGYPVDDMDVDKYGSPRPRWIV